MCAARAHEGCGPVRGLTLSEFVAWWRQHQAARSAGDGGGSSGGGASGELLYVKDWHFTRDFPQYQVGGGTAHAAVRSTRGAPGK